MKTKGLTLTELAVVIATIVLLTGVLMPALNGSRETAIRLVCQTNLTGIGRAMAAHADEHDGDYPRAGTASCVWSTVGHLPSWSWYKETAFNLGQATVTSSFYLLIKGRHLTPKQFVCKGDKGALEFSGNRAGPTPGYPDPLTWNDFGGGWGMGSIPSPWPGQFVSYAYHMPYINSQYVSFSISDVFGPAAPVCADRNPFLDRNAVGPQIGDNSAAHGGKGQNVLYKNGSVKFEKTVTVGIGGDNIYTYGGGPTGTAPTGNGIGAPAGYNDAYLVHEKQR
ncbi:MAG TPA: hypothetical protein VMW16_10845 [Sedimentisphaerales bacterium]|nr:hypothetical protein [Sedimentisphaerales bacterium]